MKPEVGGHVLMKATDYIEEGPGFNSCPVLTSLDRQGHRQSNIYTNKARCWEMGNISFILFLIMQNR